MPTQPQRRGVLILALAVSLLPSFATAAPDLDATITVNLPGPNGTYMTFSDGTHGLPGTIDSGDIGTGPSGTCPAVIGPGYVCARGYAHASFGQYLADTKPVPLPIGVLSLGALATIKVRGAPAVSKHQIQSQAQAILRFGCYAPSPSTTGTFVFNIRFDGTRSVSAAPAGLEVFAGDFANNPQTCTTAGGLCHNSLVEKCDGSLTSEYLTLRPVFTIQSPVGQFISGWDADIDLDASHTMTLESVDVVDAQQQPIAGARAWIADENGQLATYFLRSDEVGVVGPVGATATPTPGSGATPTPAPTPAACATFLAPKLTLANVLPPAGDDTFSFIGTLGSGSTARDPDIGGLTITLGDVGGLVVPITLPPGTFLKATKTGWKVNAKRTKWTWVHPKEGAPSGVIKASIVVKKGAVALAVRAVGADVAGISSPFVTLGFPLNGDCGTTRFDGPDQRCVVKNKGKKLACK